MKMKNHYLLLATICLLAFTSCNDQTNKNPTAVTRAKDIVTRQRQCLDDLPRDCKDPVKYCDIDSCRQRVVDCHKLSYDEFNILVTGDDRINGKEILATDVYAKIKDYECKDNRVKVRITTFGNLKISVEPLDGVPFRNVYYSVALMKKIIANGAVSFTFYKGVNVDNGNKLIPFKVEYNTQTIGYYDLSDSQP